MNTGDGSENRRFGLTDETARFDKIPKHFIFRIKPINCTS